MNPARPSLPAAVAASNCLGLVTMSELATGFTRNAASRSRYHRGHYCAVRDGTGNGHATNTDVDDEAGRTRRHGNATGSSLAFAWSMVWKFGIFLDPVRQLPVVMPCFLSMPFPKSGPIPQPALRGISSTTDAKVAVTIATD